VQVGGDVKMSLDLDEAIKEDQLIEQAEVSTHPFNGWLNFSAMFRIHDMLVWIRIRIRGSMPLINGFGSRSGSSYFLHRPSRGQQKSKK